MRPFSVITVCLLLAACSAIKYTPTDSYHRNFEPMLYGYGDSIPSQWDGHDWDPAEWPLSYQNKENFTQGLFKADILRAQYIASDAVPVVVVGPNFYRLSDLDQQRICKSLDMLYGATTGKYGHFLLQDWYSRKVIGQYTKQGLTLR